MSKAKSEAIVKLKKREFVKEHKKLVNVLRTGKGMKKEAEEQKKELKKING